MLRTKRRTQQSECDGEIHCASRFLASVDQVELWRKHLLNEDPSISIAALTYWTDRELESRHKS